MTAWDIFWRSFYTNGGYQDVLNGLKTTVIIAVVGLLLGILIGMIIAIVKVTPQTNIGIKILAKIADVYVAIFRGTPIMVQLLIVYFVLFPAIGLSAGNLGVPVERYRIIVAMAVYGMNSGAYVSEIMRSGIQSVDIGQLEAGRTLGLSYGYSMLHIVIPQAIKNILPTLGNEFIVLIKETSVVSFIAVVDVTKAFKSIADSNYEYIVPYLMLGLLYLVLVLLITGLIKLIERRFAKSDRNGK
ncbi:MAG: amino acid ABC transporter permease [Clostridia bacterium]|nr:amino acid ABC transporter permease [Clostridia bacterium]